MVQDKDFTLRLVRQLSQALEKLLLGKPEESLMQKELDFDSLMKDIFKIDFSELSALSADEISAKVDALEEKNHADYYEMLGNLFFYHYKQSHKWEDGYKAKAFYEKYLHISGIFAMPVISRINELRKATEGL